MRYTIPLDDVRTMLVAWLKQNGRLVPNIKNKKVLVFPQFDGSIVVEVPNE